MGRTTTLPKATILARYEAGESVQALAAAYSRSFGTMRENLHRWGAVVRRRGPARTYTLDETFFESIDTEAKAYWLGFAYADGGVRQMQAGNWIFRVELQRSDEGHLHKLRTALQSNAPVKPSQHGEDAAAYIDICSLTLCQDLIRHGCVPDKTYVGLSTPTLPPELYRHFYRGLTDGDGGLRPWEKNHNWIFDTVGDPELMHDYQDWLVANAGVAKTALIFKRITATVQYTGGTQIERIARLLYDDATVFLDRKYAAYLALLRRPGAQLRVVG